MFPLIPFLAIVGIVGGVTALVWYSNLSRAEQIEADRKALAWFGKRFEQLTKAQQERIRQELDDRA